MSYLFYNSNEGFVRDQRGPKDQLNFAAHSEDEVDYQAPPGGFFKKGKQDPMSHRIIEKRRRDRMNNCLADLSRLIPPEYLKKGRGRIEKTEIIEMAIRHVKHLQDRTHAAERQSVADSSESYRAGFQDAIAEAVRFMVERQGHRPGDSCCVQLAKHLHTHLTKGEPPRENLPHSNGSSSESGSNSYSSNYQGQNGVMNGNEPEMYQQSPPYDQASAAPQTMECDRVYGKSSYPAQSGVMTSNEPTTAYDQASAAPQIMDCDRMAVGPISLTTRNGEYGDVMQAEADAAQAQAETARGSDAAEDYMQSYKFKNSIERRFSQTQDCEASDMSMRSTQSPSLKRRRVSKPAPYSSTTTSNSGSTEGPASNSPQDTSSDSLHMHVFEKLSPPATQYVPIFALNALGKHYVPLNIDYSCLSRHLGPYDMQDSQGGHIHTPLHPVTIHVNFQPCLLNRLKCEPHDREWRAE